MPIAQTCQTLKVRQTFSQQVFLQVVEIILFNSTVPPSSLPPSLIYIDEIIMLLDDMMKVRGDEMRPPLPFRGSKDSAALLDRGGRPTLRELLSALEFDAARGTIRLNDERVTLQLAEADRILRRELIQTLGEEEARIFLLRRGFRMGRNDAAFVARSWPALDRGDVFTAGTRLHHFSGIVRVETVHNDFDFNKRRFSAEFLWHNSLEAEEAGIHPPDTSRPACWQQIGYASGYASFFFEDLVVYKELACAAQGHRCCRVVGRLATGWGDDDPDVILFRDRIIPGARPVADRKPVIAPGPSADPTDAPPVSSVLPLLRRAVRIPLPCLVAGSGSCGQLLAATHLAKLIAPGMVPVHVHAATVSVQALREAFAPSGKEKQKDRSRVVLIENIDKLSIEGQSLISLMLAGEKPQAQPRLILTSERPLSQIAAGELSTPLWLQLAPLAIEMPPIASLGPALHGLISLRTERLAAQLGLVPPVLDEKVLEHLARRLPDGGLAGLDALLQSLIVETCDGQAFTVNLVDQVMSRLGPTPASSVGIEDRWIEEQLVTGTFSLEEHEARIRSIALDRAKGNLSAAARLLGISRAQLAYRESQQRVQT